MDRPAVIFVHIPKAAGTTLHRIIEQNYRMKHIYSTYPTVFNPAGSIEDFKQLSLTRRAQIRVLKGHLPYSLHEYLPGPSTYFTLLREPIGRVLSFYYYVRQDSEHYAHDYALAQGMTLKGYIESHATMANDNLQVRMLSGVFDQVGYGQCTPDMLETARRNLRDHFAMVGLAEHFDTTLLLLKRTFHWRNIFYVRQNVTAERPALADVPQDTVELIKDHNWLDIELYQYAKELFETRLRQTGATFARELASFQATNRRLQPVIPVYWQAQQFSAEASMRAEKLANRQSTDRRLQPLWRLYWLVRQYSVRALIRRILASRRDTA